MRAVSGGQHTPGLQMMEERKITRRNSRNVVARGMLGAFRKNAEICGASPQKTTTNEFTKLLANNKKSNKNRHIK